MTTPPRLSCLIVSDDPGRDDWLQRFVADRGVDSRMIDWRDCAGCLSGGEELVVISVADDEVGAVGRLVADLTPPRIVIHTSLALSDDVLTPARSAGHIVAAVAPLTLGACCDPTWWAITAQDVGARQVVEFVFDELRCRCVAIDRSCRAQLASSIDEATRVADGLTGTLSVSLENAGVPNLLVDPIVASMIAELGRKLDVDGTDHKP